MGEVAVEKQEFKNAIGGDVRRINLTISLEGGAAAQQAHLLKIQRAGVVSLRYAEEFRLKHLKQSGGGVCPLKVAPKANELPPLAVDHRGIAYTLEQVDAVQNRSQQVIYVGAELGLGILRMHHVIQPVETLPLLGGDFLAYLAGIFACAVDAERDGRLVFSIKYEDAGHRFQIAIPLQTGWVYERRHESLPACLGRSAAGIEHQAHGHVQLAHGILCPFEVAAHPI